MGGGAAIIVRVFELIVLLVLEVDNEGGFH